MLRLHEMFDGSVVLGDFKCIAIATVEGNLSVLTNKGKRQDIGDTTRMIPYSADALRVALEFGDRCSSLGVNGETTSDFMNIREEATIGKDMSGGLTVQQQPKYRDTTTIDAVLHLEDGTGGFVVHCGKHLTLEVRVVQYSIDDVL